MSGRSPAGHRARPQDRDRGARTRSARPWLSRRDTEDRDEGKGVVVGELVDDGPAKAAGLKVGDIIVALDGEEIDDGDELHDFLAETEPGQTVEVRVLRDGKKQEIPVELAENPGMASLAERFHWSVPDDPRHPARRDRTSSTWFRRCPTHRRSKRSARTLPS